MEPQLGRLRKIPALFGNKWLRRGAESERPWVSGDVLMLGLMKPGCLGDFYRCVGYLEPIIDHHRNELHISF